MAPVAIYDPVRSRMVAFGGGYNYTLNDVWELLLPSGGALTWREITPHGTAPDPRNAPVCVYDPLRDRMLLFGGSTGAGVYTNEVWALDFADTTWGLLTTAGTPPSARDLAAGIYDANADRLLVFGGNDGFQYLDDTWELSLGETPTWSPVSPAGVPPSDYCWRTGIVDPVRNRMLILFPGHAVWALNLTGSPTWSQLPVDGGPPNIDLQPPVYDPIADREITEGRHYFPPSTYVLETWQLAWGAPATPAVQCPEDLVWTLGTTMTVDYSITNPYATRQAFRWTLQSERNWLGFPLSGVALVDGLATQAIAIGVPVPDTAVAGLNTLVFRATALSGLTSPAPCSHHIHDVATATLVSLQEAFAQPGLVSLRWYAPAGAGVTATVYRRTSGTGWTARGSIESDGFGNLQYSDREVMPAGRYGYRLGVLERARESYVGEVWVDVPTELALAIRGAQPNPTASSVVVAFFLPTGEAAILDLLDVSGRLVARRDVGRLGAGSHVLDLSETASLPAGVYMLRLTQAHRSVSTAACVVR